MKRINWRLLLLLFFNIGVCACWVMCQECGVPGASNCEDEARTPGLLLAVNCSTNSCVATSFTFLSGVRIESRFCNVLGHDYACSAAHAHSANYDSCLRCSRNFCNGPLPPCELQRRFVVTCERPLSTTVTVVLLFATGALLLAAAGLCEVARRRRRLQGERARHRHPLVAHFRASRSFNLDSVPEPRYTAI